MRLHLGGHLSWYDPLKRDWLDIELGEAETLAELLARLAIPKGEVAVVAINGKAARPDDVPVRDSDVVELYPPLGGG